MYYGYFPLEWRQTEYKPCTTWHHVKNVCSFTSVLLYSLYHPPKCKKGFISEKIFTSDMWLTGNIFLTVDFFLIHIRIDVKSACLLCLVCPFLCPHVSTWIQLDIFSLHLMLQTFIKICQENPNWLKWATYFWHDRWRFKYVCIVDSDIKFISNTKVNTLLFP